jgi:hypothetical protein
VAKLTDSKKNISAESGALNSSVPAQRFRRDSEIICQGVLCSAPLKLLKSVEDGVAQVPVYLGLSRSRDSELGTHIAISILIDNIGFVHYYNR